MTQWSAFLQRWPVTAKLHPLPLAEKLPYLLGSVIVARTLVGLVRIAADNPAWNPTPNSRRDKMDTFLERIFMEGLGTLGTFALLHAGQDVTANLLELSRSNLRPAALVANLQGKVTQPELVSVEQALAKTFKTPLQQLARSPVLARVLYDGANLFNFKAHLANDTLWQTVAPQAEDHFARLNRTAKLPVLGGLVAATTFGGPLWQWLNDRVVRTQVVPWLSQPLVKLWGDDGQPASPPELSPTHTMIVASQPLVRLAPSGPATAFSLQPLVAGPMAPMGMAVPSIPLANRTTLQVPPPVVRPSAALPGGFAKVAPMAVAVRGGGSMTV